MYINNLIKIIWIKLSITNKVIIYEAHQIHHFITTCQKEKYNNRPNKINNKVDLFLSHICIAVYEVK